MPGIGYSEPYEVTRIINVNKTYARTGYVEPYQVDSIVIMNKTYARNRLC